MRKNTLSVVALLSLLLIAGSAFGQAKAPVEAKPVQFFFVLLNRAANPPEMSKQAREQLQEEHLANIRKNFEERKMVVAGPFMDDTAMRGVFVFQAESLEQAQEWADSDPTIKAGRLAAEVHGPWHVDPNAIHPPAEGGGMEQYSLVLMKRGDKWNPDSPEFMDAAKQHHAFIKQLTDQDKLAIAGHFPLSDKGDLLGIIISRVGAEETARLMQEDPTVKAGLFKPEIHPWAVGKGVLAPGTPLKLK